MNLKLSDRLPWNFYFPYSIHNVLSKFDEFTLFVSEKRPQISLVLPIYYELHDLLHDVAEQKEDFADLTEDIPSAIGGSIKEYIKYYTFMDASDLYYSALVLDPRVKGALFLNELGEENAGRNILQTLRDDLHRKYPGTLGWLLLPGITYQFQPEERESVCVREGDGYIYICMHEQCRASYPFAIHLQIVT